MINLSFLRITLCQLILTLKRTDLVGYKDREKFGNHQEKAKKINP